MSFWKQQPAKLCVSYFIAVSNKKSYWKPQLKKPCYTYIFLFPIFFQFWKFWKRAGDGRGSPSCTGLYGRFAILVMNGLEGDRYGALLFFGVCCAIYFVCDDCFFGVVQSGCPFTCLFRLFGSVIEVLIFILLFDLLSFQKRTPSKQTRL